MSIVEYTNYDCWKITSLLNECLWDLNDDDFDFVSQLLPELEHNRYPSLHNHVKKSELLRILKEIVYDLDDTDFTTLNEIINKLEN